MGFTIDTKPLVDMLDEIATLRSRVEELERTNETMSRWIDETCGASLDGVWITEEQIDKAWEYTKFGARDFVVAALEELGVVACKECGGRGDISEDGPLGVDYIDDCSTCHGHGWVRRNDE